VGEEEGDPCNAALAGTALGERSCRLVLLSGGWLCRFTCLRWRVIGENNGENNTPFLEAVI